MAFTYVGDLTTDRDKVRFYIQDTASAAGPKPDGANFTDAEIDGLVTAEGSWQRAVAAGFEALAAIWGNKYDFTSEGQSFRRSTPSDKFMTLAGKWRAQYGSAGTRVRSLASTRVDAYSDDINSDEV